MKDSNGIETSRRRTKPTPAKLVKCSRLNIRSGKDPDARVVGVITNSDRIKINLNDSDSIWINVVEPIYGYAKREFLEVT